MPCPWFPSVPFGRCDEFLGPPPSAEALGFEAFCWLDNFNVLIWWEVNLIADNTCHHQSQHQHFFADLHIAFNDTGLTTDSQSGGAVASFDLTRCNKIYQLSQLLFLGGCTTLEQVAFKDPMALCRDQCDSHIISHLVLECFGRWRSLYIICYYYL